jgi:hypothetical protein
MGFYGDLVGAPIRFTHNCASVSPMPTAIFVMYTTEGFAFGADGRLCRDDKTVIADDAQKVFPIEQPKCCLGYALAGIVGLTADDDGSLVFDFVSQAAEAVRFMSSRRPSDLTRYSNEMAHWLNQRLKVAVSEAKRTGRAFCYPDEPKFTYPAERGRTIARLFLAGYFGSIEGWTMLRFFHVNQALKSPTVATFPIGPGESFGYGSQLVADRLRAQDAAFAPYLIPLKEKLERATLSEAVDLTKLIIAAQSCPQAMEVDPETCALIGGTIHIATLTKESGFQWAIPPSATPLVKDAIPLPNPTAPNSN